MSSINEHISYEKVIQLIRQPHTIGENHYGYLSFDVTNYHWVSIERLLMIDDKGGKKLLKGVKNFCLLKGLTMTISIQIFK